MPFPACHPTLATSGLVLRPLAESDIPAWFARATDAEAAVLAGDPVPAAIEEGWGWLARHRQRFAERTGLRWAIVPEGAADSAGTIGLTLPAPDARVAALGFVVARAHWNRGLATGAGRAVIAYAVGTLGLEALEAEALRRNAPSRRVLEKLGFRHLRALPDPADPAEDADLYVLPAHSAASSP